MRSLGPASSGLRAALIASGREFILRGPTGNKTVLRVLARDLQTSAREIIRLFACGQRLDTGLRKLPYFASYTDGDLETSVSSLVSPRLRVPEHMVCACLVGDLRRSCWDIPSASTSPNADTMPSFPLRIAPQCSVILPYRNAAWAPGSCKSPMTQRF